MGMHVSYDDDNIEKQSGYIKWFDRVKGFGSIISDETKEDILLHINVLRKFGQSAIAENTHIEFMANYIERGVQAAEILSVDPVLDALSTLEDFEDFDIEDIMVHIEVLRRSGLSNL